MGEERLTKRERAVLDLFDGDEVNEGRIADELYPLVLRPRLVVNSLIKKGLITTPVYLDEEVGYLLEKSSHA